jgi:hypothetical protein
VGGEEGEEGGEAEEEGGEEPGEGAFGGVVVAAEDGEGGEGEEGGGEEGDDEVTVGVGSELWVIVPIPGEPG